MTVHELIQELSKFNQDQEVNFTSFFEQGRGGVGCGDMDLCRMEEEEGILIIHFNGEVDFWE